MIAKLRDVSVTRPAKSRSSEDSEDSGASEEKSETNADPILQGINLNIAPGAFVAIISPVGSGKSTLLNVLLGETGETTGEVITNFSTAAFCPQVSWITRGTIRQNIIGMSPWDEKLYKKVVQACQLQQDFEELPNGDQTSTGTRGSHLSGGQQTRVALARALYSRQAVLILGDVLTGLDRVTEQAISVAVFGPDGMLRQSNSTVVLATNSTHRCRQADHILVLGDDGRVSEEGSFEALSAPGGYLERASAAPTVETSREKLELSDETLQELQLPQDDDDINGDETRRT